MQADKSAGLFVEIIPGKKTAWDHKREKDLQIFAVMLISRAFPPGFLKKTNKNLKIFNKKHYFYKAFFYEANSSQ